jgi:SAM-dependent methyltransferase
VRAGASPTNTLQIETDLAADELRPKLAAWAPWLAVIEFSNGVSTAEFEPKHPQLGPACHNLLRFEPHIPFEELRDVLDVGCNVGYNGIYLGSKYGARTVGIDIEQRLLDAAEFLGSLAGIEAEFLIAHADSFVRPSAFDVILHFGTLYHLQNPLRSLQAAYESLKPGGYLALETSCYENPEDERLCYFIYGVNNDPSNFFSFSPFTLKTCLGLLGFEEPIECFRHDVALPGATEKLGRIGFVARKGMRPRDHTRQWPRWAPVGA